MSTVTLGAITAIAAFLPLLVLAEWSRSAPLWPLDVARTEASTVAVFAVFVAAVVANVAPVQALLDVQAEHERLMQRIGLEPDGRKYTPHVTIARLRAAERASAADLVRRLVTVPPSLAQLFASIAASDATHAAALGG